VELGDRDVPVFLEAANGFIYHRSLKHKLNRFIAYDRQLFSGVISDHANFRSNSGTFKRKIIVLKII
jgi:hypothetical protein